MPVTRLSAEVVASVIFGLLQIVTNLITIWQQRQLRLAYGKSYSHQREAIQANKIQKSDRTCDDTQYEVVCSIQDNTRSVLIVFC